MPGLHALLSASGAKKWLACPPSARLEERIRERFGESTSEAAEEGTQAHAVAELKLRKENEEINDFTYQAMRKKLGAVPGEMDRVTDEYVDLVLSRLYEARRYDPGAKLFIEQRLDFSPWVPKGHGTGDAMVVSDWMLDVVDLKYGKGVPVQAEGNPQCRLYGLGGLNAFGDLYDFDRVRVTIAQLRINGGLTDETLSRQALLDWGEEIKPRAQMAWRGEGECCPGDHCRFCMARAICGARMTKVLELFRYAFQTPGLIPDEEIPGILKLLDISEAWIKDIRTYARSQALRGQSWPGWKLVRGKKGNRAWSDEEKVIEQLVRAGYDRSSITTTKLKSVKDVEDMLGKQAFEALMKPFVTQSEGALNLVPTEDKRAEFSAADADFSDLATQTSTKMEDM